MSNLKFIVSSYTRPYNRIRNPEIYLSAMQFGVMNISFKNTLVSSGFLVYPKLAVVFYVVPGFELSHYFNQFLLISLEGNSIYSIPIFIFLKNQ